MVADIEKELAWARIRECADRVRAMSRAERFWATVRVYIAARRARNE